MPAISAARACVTGLLASLAALATVPVLAQTTADNAAAFTFAAVGDMPYELPGEPVRFRRLIAALNQRMPAFTIHIGDIISGRAGCSDDNFNRVKELFATFDQPLIYTPGDNEWTDCHRVFGGGYDPLERLARIKAMFFRRPEFSLGRTPMRVQTQARVMAKRFAQFPENQRWTHKGIVFATAHIIGSNNNLQPKRPETLPEFAAREQANLAWIAAAFDLAGQQDAAGLVLAWQANVHRTPRHERGAPFSRAYTNIIDSVERGAQSFGKPVLVIYGDFHTYDVRPFVNSARVPLANVTHLQVFGDQDVHAVLVTADPASKHVFSIKPLLVPGNPPP